MKTLDKKARGEIVFLLGLFLLLAEGIGFLFWQQSQSANKSPWQVSSNSWQKPIIALSPDGLFLAGICPTPPPKNARPNPNPHFSPPQSKVLVVWRVSDRTEISRQNLSDGNDTLSWVSNGQLLAVGQGINKMFLWNNNALTPFQSKSSFSQFQNFGYGVIVQRDFDSDIFLVARPEGDVEAHRISNGTTIPIQWRSSSGLNNDSNYGMDIALQPSAAGAPLRAAVVESDYRLQKLEEKAHPRPKLTAPPKPPPPPKLNAAQRAFLEKEKRLNTEVEDVVNKLMSEEETLPDAEKADLEARANALNAQIKAERERVFPPKPTPKAPPQKPTRMRISMWDLSNNRLLWRRQLRARFDEKSVFWSPDGQLLAVTGVEVPVTERGYTSWRSRGIAILDGATGRQISQMEKTNDSTFSGESKLFWLDGFTFVAKDQRLYYERIANSGFAKFSGAKRWTSRDWRTLRFVDARSGQTTQYLQIPEEMKQARFVTPDAGGTTWAVASGQDGWRAYAKSELEQADTSPPKFE